MKEFINTISLTVLNENPQFLQSVVYDKEYKHYKVGCDWILVCQIVQIQRNVLNYVPKLGVIKMNETGV